MAEHYLRQHALAHRGFAASSPLADAGVHLWPQPPLIQLCLRGDGRRGFQGAVRRALGVAPPTRANTASVEGDVSILWLGPDEWLVVATQARATLLADLESALDGLHALVSDVSHSRIVLGLAGRNAREVLLKGCSLDLDPVAFATGQCAQAPLARAHVLLHQVGETPAYHVYVHRSFADYVYAWLHDAASEYGVATTPG